MLHIFYTDTNKEDVFEKTILVNEYFRMGMNHTL